MTEILKKTVVGHVAQYVRECEMESVKVTVLSIAQKILLAIWVKEQTECAVKSLQARRGCWKNTMFANLIEEQGHFYQ